MNLNVYTRAIDRLEIDLEELTRENLSNFIHFEKALGMCTLTFHEVRKLVLKFGFMDNKEEIQFFKTVKPRICSKLTFYRRLARIESHRPKFTIQDQIMFLKAEIVELHNFYELYRDSYEYYQTGQTYQDTLFFTRNQSEIVLNNRNSDYLTDPEFSTIHDKTVATIIAYENIEKYLANEVRKLERLNKQENIQSDAGNDTPKADWTGLNIAYVELLYGIKESGVINHGQTGVMELHQLFSQILNLPQIDIYRTFHDLQKRKKSKTQFLDKMKEQLLRKLDDLDEFTPED